MILIIDNYDSFTYNLYQYIGEKRKDVVVYKNDALRIHDIEKLNIEKIILSPGPGRPENSGITLDVVQHFSGKIPILGVCLGHQAIGMAFGGRIVHAKTLMHGKTSPIFHKNDPLFEGIENPFTAMRYHSLSLEEKSLPPTIKIIAYDDTGEIMALKHITHPVYGVQFHPESIGSKTGKQILFNFLKI